MKKPELKEMPLDLKYLYDAYKDVKFSRIENDGVTTLYPRDELTFESVDTYGRISGLNFELWEVSALMSIDGTFNKHRNG